MLTRALISLLDKANSPRSVAAITWALEKSTGISTTELFYRKYPQIYSQIYGHSSYSGKTITVDTALESTAFYAGVKIIAEDMGTLPFFLYRRSKDRTQVDKAYDHPLYRVLHDLPNPEVDAGEFVEALTAHAIVARNGYALIQRMDSGVFLYPWQPQDVRLDRNARGALVYIHKEGNLQEKTYPRTDVFHLRPFTMDCGQGDDLLQRARHGLGLTLSAEEYAAKFFANDATPGLVLTRPAGSTLGPEQVRLMKDAWIQWHRGNPHEPAVLQDGMDAKVLTPNMQDTQLVEQRKFQITEVCRVLRLPPHKLADLDRATFANIEQLSIEYIQQTLSPWVRRWRNAVYRCLLTVDEQLADQLYAEHAVEAMQRGDFATQAEGWRKLLEKGVYSINEVRRFLNFNPVPGGDERFIQLNLGTVQEIAAGANLPNAQPGLVPVKPANN